MQFATTGTTVMANFPLWWVGLVRGRICLLGYVYGNELPEPWAAYFLGPPGKAVTMLIERFKAIEVPDELLARKIPDLSYQHVAAKMHMEADDRLWLVTSPDDGSTVQFVLQNERRVTTAMLQAEHWSDRSVDEHEVSLTEAIIRALQAGRLDPDSKDAFDFGLVPARKDTKDDCLYQREGCLGQVLLEAISYEAGPLASLRCCENPVCQAAAEAQIIACMKAWRS